MSSGRAISPAPPHTQTGTLSAWHHCLAPGCHPPWDLLGSWVQRAWRPLASRGKERHLCPSGRWGDRAGRRPPTSSLHPGSPQHSAWLCLSTPVRAMGFPSPGVGGQLLLGAKPHGAQSHIPRRWPRPTFDLTHSIHFRKCRTLHPPASSRSLPRGLSAGLCGHGFQETGDLHPPVACNAEGQVPAYFPDPAGHISVEASQQDGLGSWSFSSPTSLVLFMFLFTNWSGVLQWGRAALPSPWVSPGEFWLEPICRVGLRLPCHPTKDHTVK